MARAQRKPRKFSIVIVLVLFVAIFGSVAMMMDIKPQQTQVEKELDAAAFLGQKQ